MWYSRTLPDGIQIVHTRPEHATQLEELQRGCFPTLDDAERFKAAHYRKHIELFPDGQFVALDGDRVIGATTTGYTGPTSACIRTSVDAASRRRCTRHARRSYGVTASRAR